MKRKEYAYQKNCKEVLLQIIPVKTGVTVTPTSVGMNKTDH